MIYVQCSTVWLEMPSQLISIMHMAWFGHFLSFSCWISAINMNGCKFQHDCMPKNIAKTFFLTELSVNVRKFWPSYAGFQFNVPNIKSQVKKKKHRRCVFYMISHLALASLFPLLSGLLVPVSQVLRVFSVKLRIFHCSFFLSWC